MSFLEETDAKATLEATLAFVDSWEANPTDSSSLSSPTSGSASSPQSKQSPKRPANKKPRKRKKYPNSSSTVLQRRKKAEILALREQAEQLQAQLLVLQSGGRLLTPADGNSTVALSTKQNQPAWKTQAEIQYQYRLQAESTNRKLKGIMNNQVKVHDALRTLLQKSSVLEGMDFVWQDPCRPLAEAPYSMEQLQRRVERLYLDADRVFQADQDAAVTVSSTVKPNHPLGKTVELVSTTPMICPLSKASETLWKWFGLKKAQRHETDTIERNYTLQLKSDIGALDFKKQNVVRKFEEDDRVVVIWADSLRLPKFGLQFRNETRMLVTRSPDNPGASVLRTFQQLYMDVEGSELVDGAKFAQEPAFEELGKMYRKFLQSQQTVMLEATRRETMLPQVSV